MKRSYIIMSLAILAAFAVGLTGFSLAEEGEGEAVKGKDRLVGVMVTTDSVDLFDMEGFLEKNALRLMDGGSIGIDSGGEKLYAETVEGETSADRKYVFESVDGFFLTELTEIAPDGSVTTFSDADDAFSDVKASLKEGDEGREQSLEGTIYIAYGRNGGVFYFNPIYQEPDGRVYLTEGSGAAIQDAQSEGTAFTHRLDEEYTTTVNGVTKKDSFSAAVTLEVVYAPEKIAILQMDEDSGVVKREEYPPGEAPETITPEAETDYIVVESLKRGADGAQSTQRELFGREDTSLHSFECRDDGVCVKRYSELLWK